MAVMRRTRVTLIGVSARRPRAVIDDPWHGWCTVWPSIRRRNATKGQFTIGSGRVAQVIVAARHLVITCLILALGSPVSAQYFGRNKVRYRSFDFHVMRTAHFDIYFYSSEREGVDIAARLAERWYARLSRQLN